MSEALLILGNLAAMAITAFTFYGIVDGILQDETAKLDWSEDRGFVLYVSSVLAIILFAFVMSSVEFAGELLSL